MRPDDAAAELQAIIGVPGVVTVLPRDLPPEAVGEKEQRVSYYHVVVGAANHVHHHDRVTGPLKLKNIFKKSRVGRSKSALK